MSQLLPLVRDLFLAPPSRAETRAMPPPAPCAAVLARPREAAAAVPALALALARRQRAACAVACGWRLDRRPAPHLPANAAARRLALRLDARGLAAEASGRLVRVRLPDDPAAAAAAAERAAATGSAPVVVGLAGPRQPALDRLLRVQDVVVVVHGADADGGLAEAVEASLADLPVPVVGCRAPSTGPTHALAAAGLAVPPSLRQALLPALEVVG
jgi:hypothetical protein